MCEVKRGTLSPSVAWQPFVAAFTERFGFAPMWVEVDEVSNTPHPRVSVVVERTEQRDVLVDHLTLCPGVKRSVLGMLGRLGTPLQPSAADGVLTSGPVDPQECFVVVSCFEDLAVQTAENAVTPDELRDFELALGLGEGLWRTRREFGRPYVFTTTDELAERLREPGEAERVRDHWYAAAKPHDEFGYLTREGVVVTVSSKETVDRDFAGNLFYFFR